jgi:hypothetical protein
LSTVTESAAMPCGRRGKAGPDLGVQVLLVVGRRHDDQAVHPARDQVGDEQPLPLGLLVQARREEGDLPLPAPVLERPQKAAREAVAHVLQEYADHARATHAAAEVAGGPVGSVVKPGDRLEDAGAHVRGDLGLVVHHPGHGLDAHARQRGDVAHPRSRLAIWHQDRLSR